MAGNMIKAGENLPRHIAIIMDGNGRWAKSRLMPRMFGHKAGLTRMIDLLEHAYDRGVDYVTVYALSTENLNRPKAELEGLYELIRTRFTSLLDRIFKRGIRLKILGDISLLPKDVQKTLTDAEKESEHFVGKGFNIALAYGARAEIVRAVNLAVEKGEKVTEKTFADLLYTCSQPEPDLIIRTGKEKRLSNFLLYQSAYAELYFSDKMFPEFSNEDLDEAFLDYSKRTRRFGKTDEQKKQDNK
ncbi:MAG: di-trans,poly-cis-decaprenylcistransferase [Clostridiales bacterium]|nr:di-trans,poly-cis-decaprenylcistransferase [Clostridiales bacterium]